MPSPGRLRTYHSDRPATAAERQRRFALKRTEELCRLRQQLAQRVYHKSQRYDWPTPWDVFYEYDAEFHFTLDVCATADNTKCARYFTREQDGLAQDWGDAICWCNPPYGRETGLWLAKAYRSSLAGATVVCLVAARTSNQWWHTWVQDKAEVRFRQGRITFVGAENSAGFPSAAVIYRPS